MAAACSTARRSCTQGAQKSNARQSSRNLLLTPGAEIDTKPELEIYADDVQCSHGATTGQLDPDALFYLRSRGLSEPEARSALTRAFAGAVLSQVDVPALGELVHDELDRRLARLLRGDVMKRRPPPPARRRHRMARRSTSRRSAATSRSSQRTVHGKPLVYLDNAASSQRPRAVIDAMSHYYETTHANVHRGVHTLSQEATDLFEGAREKVRRFINARSTKEIVFVRGTTEAINLVAQSFGRPRFGPGDEILITWLEHHANIVPWQLLCEQTGATLKVAPITPTRRGRLRRVRRPARRRARSSWRSRTSRTRSAPSCPVRAVHPRGAGSAACPCCSTARRPCRTSPSTCRRSTATSTASRATRCAARPASACCTGARRCCAKCRPGKAAAT